MPASRDSGREDDGAAGSTPCRRPLERGSCYRSRGQYRAAGGEAGSTPAGCTPSSPWSPRALESWLRCRRTSLRVRCLYLESARSCMWRYCHNSRPPGLHRCHASLESTLQVVNSRGDYFVPCGVVVGVNGAVGKPGFPSLEERVFVHSKTEIDFTASRGQGTIPGMKRGRNLYAYMHTKKKWEPHVLSLEVPASAERRGL